MFRLKNKPQILSVSEIQNRVVKVLELFLKLSFKPTPIPNTVYFMSREGNKIIEEIHRELRTNVEHQWDYTIKHNGMTFSVYFLFSPDRYKFEIGFVEKGHIAIESGTIWAAVDDFYDEVRQLTSELLQNIRGKQN